MSVAALHGQTILIVEDAYLIALEAQRIAEEAGASKAILASTLEDARAILAGESPIDACVLDLKLGEVDATPLLHELSDRGIPVLVATGFDSAMPNVDVPLLKKPYQEGEFVEAIRAVIHDGV